MPERSWSFAIKEKDMVNESIQFVRIRENSHNYV